MGFTWPLLADGYTAAGDEHTIYMYILDVTEGKELIVILC